MLLDIRVRAGLLAVPAAALAACGNPAAIEVRVQDSLTAQPVRGAAVTLYAHRWCDPFAPGESKATTGPEGTAILWTRAWRAGHRLIVADGVHEPFFGELRGVGDPAESLQFVEGDDMRDVTQQADADSKSPTIVSVRIKPR
jgi:hypothetical protein